MCGSFGITARPRLFRVLPKMRSISRIPDRHFIQRVLDGDNCWEVALILTSLSMKVKPTPGTVQVRTKEQYYTKMFPQRREYGRAGRRVRFSMILIVLSHLRNPADKSKCLQYVRQGIL